MGMRHDLGALGSYVRFYLTVVTQLDAVWSEVGRAHATMKTALGPFADRLAPVESATLAAALADGPPRPSALDALWKPEDPEQLGGLGDVYEVVGRFAFQGDDDENLSRAQVLVSTARNEIHQLRSRLEDLGKLPDVARAAIVRLADAEARALSARRAERVAGFAPLAETLQSRARQTIDAVRAVPVPDVSNVETAADEYRRYVARVQQVYDTCLPFLKKALAAVFAYAGAEVPESWPDTLPLVADLPAELLAVPTADSPELSGAQRGLRELDDEEIGLKRGQGEIAAALTRLDADIAAFHAKEVEVRGEITTTMALVDHAANADQAEQAVRAIAAYEQQRAARLVTVGEIRARHQQLEAAIHALTEELSNREKEIQNFEVGLEEIRGKEPLMFGKDEWRAKVAGVEQDIELGRVTYNQRLGLLNQLKIDLSALGVQIQTEEGQISLLERWIADAKSKREVAEKRVREIGETLGAGRPARPLSLGEAEAALAAVQQRRAEIVERIERLLADVRRHKEDNVRIAARLKQIEGERQRMRAMVDSAQVAATQGRDAAIREMAAQRRAAVEHHLVDVLSGLEKSLAQVDAVFLEPAQKLMLDQMEDASPPSTGVGQAVPELVPVVASLGAELEPLLLAQDAMLGQIQREFCDVAPDVCRTAWA